MATSYFDSWDENDTRVARLIENDDYEFYIDGDDALRNDELDVAFYTTDEGEVFIERNECEECFERRDDAIYILKDIWFERVTRFDEFVDAYINAYDNDDNVFEIDVNDYV